MILAKILKEKRKTLILSKQNVSLRSLKDKISLESFSKRSFRKAIFKPNQITLIAEIKKASPSKGILINKFNPVEIAKIYQKAGVNALSIITEESFFQGKLSFINQVKKQVSLPILRKDFIFDQYQIYESKAYGADAILLIARILSAAKLLELSALAKKLNLEYIVEVHTPADVKKALKIKADIIGINNRDLNSFKVNLKTTQKLKLLIPAHKITISESGIKNNKDIVFLEKLGLNAVLVGESLLRSNNILSKVKELRYGR